MPNGITVGQIVTPYLTIRGTDSIFSKEPEQLCLEPLIVNVPIPQFP